jgi:hypothetical protein
MAATVHGSFASDTFILENMVKTSAHLLMMQSTRTFHFPCDSLLLERRKILWGYYKENNTENS